MIKFKNKKWFLGIGAGLLTTAAVATPLICSCSANDPNKPIDTDGNDRKYNITSATYDNLEQQFIFKYEQQQLSKGLLGDKLNKNVSALKNTLVQLREQTNKVNYNFYFRTNRMIHLAHREYSVQLIRNLSTTTEGDYESTRIQYEKSYRTYLRNRSFSPSEISNHVISFNNSFRNLKTTVNNKFDDSLFALDQLKSDLTVCFHDASDQTEFVHATSLITKLFNDYSFTISDNAPYLDKLIEEYGEHGTIEPGKFVPGKNIIQFIPDLFKCKTKNDKGQMVDVELDKEGNWAKKLLPQYVIKPFLSKIVQDPHLNQYGFVMDWQIMNTDYEKASPEQQAKVTGHYYAPTEEATSKIKDENDYLNLKEDEKESVVYLMKISREYEEKMLKQTYGELKFSFTDDTNYHAYEVFYPCLEAQDRKAKISKESLANTGLMIEDKDGKVLLRDIIEKLNNRHPAFEDLTLKEKFVSLVDFYSVSKLVDDNIHKVENTIYASYINSPYADHSTKIGDFTQQNLLISKELWLKASDCYGKVKGLVDTYKETADGDLVDSSFKTITAQIVFLGVIGALVAGCIWKGLMYKAFFVIAAIGLVCCGFCIATIALSRKLKNMASEYEFSAKKLIADPTYKAVSDVVYDEYQVNLYSDENIFRKAPLKNVMDSYKYFNNFYNSYDYKRLTDAAIQHDADKVHFMKVLSQFELCYIISFIGSLVVSLGWIPLIIILVKEEAMAASAETANTTYQAEILQEAAKWAKKLSRLASPV